MPAVQPGFPTPTVQNVRQARNEFISGEPRNLFYLVATELIDLVRKRLTDRVSVAQALAVLLQTWNVSFYRFRGGFHESDLASIETLVKDHLPALDRYRARQIAGFGAVDEGSVRRIFSAFQKELGAVGAAKSLHLLAPMFFPLWDTAIARAYHVKLTQDGYIDFIRIAKTQCQVLLEGGAPWTDL